MESYAGLLLDVWRAACRHIEIDQSADDITRIVAPRLPLARLVVRRIDVDRSAIETVADSVVREGAPLEPRRDSRPDELRRLVTLWQQHRAILVPAGSAASLDLSPILPRPCDGDVMAGALANESGLTGALLLLAPLGKAFTEEHLQLLEALLEPFSVALENDRRLRELRTLRDAAEERRSLLARLGRRDLADEIVGADSGLREVMARVDLVARSEVPVLIFGETGAGKELIARAIRNRSHRASGPFIRVNCGAIPPGLIDSQLFGHERGSFTGAVTTRHGWFERADRGTLLLDEIGDLPLDAQARLLRVLQDGSFERVGGHQQVQVDVRIVAATNRDLSAMVQSGTFREDLWYRLAVFPIAIPPLRDRPEDIPALAAHFARRAATRFGLPLRLPEPEDVDRLVGYSWPGNIRELAAVMDRAAILGNGQRLEIGVALGTAPAPVQRAAPRMEGPLPVSAESDNLAPLNAAIQLHIERALAQAYGRIEGPFGAAALLHINPHTLRARMRKLGIDWARFRRSSGQVGPVD
jgi:hydrogenase-4 transcriptional activator